MAVSPLEENNVWPRFARMAVCCSIKVDHAEVWRVEVRRKDGSDSVAATGSDLLQTVHDALLLAEKRGWHFPEINPDCES